MFIMKKLTTVILLIIGVLPGLAHHFTFDGITMMQPFENFMDSLKTKGYDIWPDETCFLGSGYFFGRDTQVFLVTIEKKSDVYYANEITLGYSFMTRQEANAFMQSAIIQLDRMYPHFKATTERDWRILDGENGKISVFMGEKENMSNSNMIYPNKHEFVVDIIFETDSSDEPLTIKDIKRSGYNENEVMSNKCGDHLTWSYNETTKVLTISGSGDMFDYDEVSQTPWYDISSEVQYLVISSGVKTIGKNAFKQFNSLSDVRIGNSVTTIGSSAFEGCSVLGSLAIPNTVKSIGECAFQYCFDLTSVTIGNGVKKIGKSAFFGCGELAGISVEKNNKTYDSRNNCNAIIESKSNTLILGCKSTIIPNNVIRIGELAFNSCSGLKKINIPNSVNYICSCAFFNCKELESVTLSNSLTNISYRTFALCKNLKTVTIPDSVFRIDKEAFYWCESLDSIIISNSVTRVGARAFSNCKSLISVTIPCSVLVIGANAFEGCDYLKDIHCEWREPMYVYPNIFDSSTYSNATLFVPLGTRDAYQEDTNWGVFENIVEK